MKPLLPTALGAATCFLCCEPNFVIGRDPPEPNALLVDAAESGGATGLDPLVDAQGGAGGQSNGVVVLMTDECRLFEDNPDHEEGPVPLCCPATNVLDGWREEALSSINQLRQEDGAPDYTLDPSLNEAAQAWAVHWYAHADEPFAGNVLGAEDASSRCGGVAVGFLLTDRRVSFDENGLVNPGAAALSWSSPASNPERFFDPTNLRLGVGFYRGLIVGMPGP